MKRNAFLQGLPRAALASMIGLLAPPALAVVPVNAGAITFSPIPVNLDPGDQFNSHIAQDLIAYSDPSTIHYYRLSSGLDTVIQAAATPAIDLLSDIADERIVLTRAFSGGRRALMLFNASSNILTELLPDPNSNRFGSAIGGNTVAWVDYGVESHGEMMVLDVVSDLASRLTFDTVGDQNPQVAPDGSIVVWEHCQTSMLNCDIYSAAWDGSSWSVTPISEDAGAAEANPDTNGAAMVFESRSGSVWNVMIRPTVSGTTYPLELSGEETNPSISGDLILFEHRAGSADATDLFAYEMSTNRLFQLTSTPTVNETLCDVADAGFNQYRITWTGDEAGFDERNVYAASFTVPPVSSVSFDSAGQTVIEGGIVIFKMILSAASSVPANFHIGIGGAGSSADNADFASIMPVGITMPAGQTEQQVALYLADDNQVEGLETAVLTLVPDDAGVTVGSQGTHTVNITDNDSYGFVQFGSASYSVKEKAGAATISATRTGGSAGLVSLRYTTTMGGTATAGTDYTPVSGELVWASGDTAPKSFTVPILDDRKTEGDETVKLIVTRVGSAGFGSPSSATLTIVDDECLLFINLPLVCNLLK